jgi:ATP-dependent exoDNAse (exonuclease V) beta subunit
MSQDQSARIAAIDTARSFIVQAPAGSGKTELLVQRMLALLAHASHPSEILAITFTKKAAGEMRERLLSALQSAQTDYAPKTSPERERWQLARAARARDRECNWRLLERPHLLSIDTFDAFSLRVLRASPYATEFRSAALASLEEDASAQYREAARRSLLDLSDEVHARAVSTVLAALDNRVDEIIALLATLLSKRALWLERVADDSEEAVAAMREAMVRCVEAEVAPLLRLWPTEETARVCALASFAADSLLSSDGETSNYARVASVVAAASLNRGEIESLHEWRSLAGFLLTDTGWRRQFNKTQGFPSPKDKGLTDDEKQQRYEALASIKSLLVDLQALPNSERLLEALTTVQSLPDLDAIARQDAILRATLRLLKIAASEMLLIERTRSMIDFSGVAMSAQSALANYRDEVYGRFEAAIAHILIDEYQDTNPSQTELVRSLVEDWQPSDGRTLFLVGDPMQSIYAFRDADVSLFADAWTRGIGNVALTPLTLTANYRSQPVLVDWVNKSIAQVFVASRRSIASAPVAFARAEAARLGKPQDAAPMQWQFESADDEAAAIMDDIDRVRRENPAATIAILVRSRSHAAEVLRALRNAKISFTAREFASWLDRPIVRDLLSLAYVIAQPADRLSWFAWLRSPMVGLTLDTIAAIGAFEETERLVFPQVLTAPALLDSVTDEDRARIESAWRALADTEAQANYLTLAARVHRVFLACGGSIIAASEEAQVEVEEFLALLESEASDSLLPPREQFEAVVAGQKRSFSSALSEPGTLADASPPIEVLTLHKAKGLEWDCVYMPQLQKVTGKDSRELIHWHFVRFSPENTALKRNSSSFLLAAKETRRSSAHSVYDFVRSMNVQARNDELKRLLYVGCTRAKSRLILSISGEAKSSQTNTLAALLTWPEIERDASEAAEVSDARPSRRVLGASLTRVQWFNTVLNHARIQKADLGSQSIPTSPTNSENAAQTSAAKDQIAFGIVGHKLIEGLAAALGRHREFSPSKEAVKRLLLGEGASRESIDGAANGLLTAVERMRKSNHFAFIHDTRHQGGGNELALIQSANNGTQLLRMDRTFIDTDGVRWIVDYKFADSAEVDAHRAQLESYRSALLDVEPSRTIRCAVYFPLQDHFASLDL